MSKPDSETWYVWKVLGAVEGEEKPRLFTPHQNLREHEHAFDLCFHTVEEAHEALKNWGHEEEAHEDGWVLCKQDTVPVEVLQSRQEDLILARSICEEYGLQDAADHITAELGN